MKFKQNQIVFFILLFLVIAGSGLRLIRIDASSMWVDEANTYFTAKSVIETGVPNMPTGNVYGRAPLYTYTVAGMYQFFGVSLENARIASALFGILSILLAFVIATLLFDWRTGLVTACFMTFSSFEIGWSRVARMYAQFQFMTLLSVLFFILGFERQIIAKLFDRHGVRRRGLLTEIRFGVFEGVDFIALLIFGLITAVTYLWIQPLAGFTVLGLVFYAMVCCTRQMICMKGRKRWLNKYSVVSIMTIIGFIVLFPKIRPMTDEFLNYLPAWASEGSSASLTYTLFDFLFSWQRFPLGLLFVWGLIQILFKQRQSAWMTVFLFIVPLILLTFAFTHRHNKYLFFVYPFFLMLAAYGLIRVLELSSLICLSNQKVNKWIRHYIVPGLIILVFIVSPWLRIAKNIPWLADGYYNGAVYFNEWKEASEILHLKKRSGDLIITSLPEVMLYYDIDSDWALNWNNYNLSSKRIITDTQGRIMEVYAGKPLIDSLETLKQLVDSHQRGWIVLTRYHFQTSVYVPEPIREYLEKQFPPPQLTHNKDNPMHIYHWNHGGGDAL